MSGMFSIALALSNPKIEIMTRLSSPVKKLSGFESNGIATSGDIEGDKVRQCTGIEATERGNASVHYFVGYLRPAYRLSKFHYFPRNHIFSSHFLFRALFRSRQ